VLPGEDGVIVPFGEVLVELLPEEFGKLLAPAAVLPALLFDPPVALPVVVEFAEFPPAPDAVPPVPAPPPAAPVPAPPPPPPAPPPPAAKAIVVESASATASPIVVSFIGRFLFSMAHGGQTTAKPRRS
jgi:hypothetical protein